MIGLAHRGFTLHDYDHQLVHVLAAAGYHSELVGEQHISADPAILGYDVVHEISDTGVGSVAPPAIESLRSGIREPFFGDLHPRPRLAFPTTKASLLDRGIGVMLILRGPEFGGGRAYDELVSHVDLFPTVCELAGIESPAWLVRRSLLGLVRGEEPPGTRSEIFAELTYHAAYEPQPAIRTERYKYIRRFDDTHTR